jgi:hypothetical protein
MKFLNKLYLAKSENNKIFKINAKKDLKEGRLNFKGDIKEADTKFIKNLKDKIRSHRVIRFTLFESFKLYFSSF